MKSVHLVITDLFLPKDFAAEVCAGLRLPALEKILARGASRGADPSTRPLVLSAVEGSGRTDVSGVSLENHLCELFGVPCQPDVPIAPISASFDGLDEGCWLRADPVHLRLQRDQMVLLPNVEVSAGEAVQLCAALNGHFAGQGMEFFAPHPQRWYVRLDRLPDIETVPLSQAAGRNVRGLLPKGNEGARWHQLFNEVQMLLFAHPVNEAREARGELPVNSLWFWGSGCDTLLAKPADCGSSREAALCAPEGCDTTNQGDCGCSSAAPLLKESLIKSVRGEYFPFVPFDTPRYARHSGRTGNVSNHVLGLNQRFLNVYDSVSSNEVLAEMFASAAGIPFAGWADKWCDSLSLALMERLAIRLGCPDAAAKSLVISHKERGFSSDGKQLLVWTGLRSALQQGDLSAWRDALQDFEIGYAQPLWQALRSGKISQLQIDILGGSRVQHIQLDRADAWAFWRRSKPLSGCSMV